MEQPIPALVLAAGMGTRMRSERTKVLHELGGIPLIVRVLKVLAEFGARPLVVVVGHQAADVEALVRRYDIPSDLVFALQQPQRGTGDAVSCGLKALGEDFSDDVFLCGADTPMLRAATLGHFAAFHRASGADLSFVSARLDDPGAYGRVVRDARGKVAGIVEARDASPEQLAIDEVNTGVYLARADFLRRNLAALRPDNSQVERYLTDLVAMARSEGLVVDAWLAPQADEFAGINSRVEMASMEAKIREQVNQRLMADGVSMLDPASVYVSEESEVGRDTFIGPNVQILGHCRIGENVRIEGTAYLRDVAVGDRCHLKLGVRAEQCTIGPDSEIGPFAHLRVGTDLEGHNRIGNFVETKKAHLGHGTKASHLSYLGDAVIGRETNVGCGVITVNYDGYDKHLTRIGDRCMVGCDTQLVAPVTVGDDVYVASGTTILHDVPEGALTLSHHPQREKLGWTRGWHKRHRGCGAGGGSRASGSQDRDRDE